jgi:hypothetical protein
MYFAFDGTNIATYQQGGSVAYGTTLSGNFAHGMASQTWYHIAVARQNGTARIFVGGVQKGSYTDNSNYGFNTATGAYAGTAGQANTFARMGESQTGANNNNGANYDDFRITVGLARYTSGFTPPTAAFTED